MTILLLPLLSAVTLKVSRENIIKALKVAKVKGRIETIKVSDEFTLMIDYAHNAMALESLLTTLKEYHPHRLVCLFGCGGNRAKSRRYEMGEVSGRLADLTIITSDNPRFEEPQDIIDDIKTGIARTKGKYVRKSVIVKKLLPMPFIMESRETLLCLPARDMRITRKSRVKNILWMRECLSQKFWRKIKKERMHDLCRYYRGYFPRKVGSQFFEMLCLKK